MQALGSEVRSFRLHRFLPPLHLYILFNNFAHHQVTFIEAMDTLMATFDPDIRRLADRLLIKPRAIGPTYVKFALSATSASLSYHYHYYYCMKNH